MKYNQKRKHSVASQGRTTLNPIKTGLFALALASGLTASAQTTLTSTNFTVGATVPDNNLSGLASAKTVSTPIAYVTGLKVNVKLSGTFNGDVYCYLAHNGTNAILLNRAGRSPTSNPGYSDQGFDLTFDDASTNGDVHVYGTKLGGPISGPLTNSWAPDARRTSPTDVLTGDARTGFLSSFNGMNPNGEWVLFVADMEAGDIYTLNNWGLEITGYTPSTIVSAPVTSTDVNGNVTVGLNHAPILKDIVMGAVANHPRSILFEKVDAHCFDLDHDALTMTVSATSTNGAIITQSATAITYTPVANFVGEDRFTFTVSDGRGGISTATIIVEVSSADALTPNITGSSFSGGAFHVRFAGIPGFTYHIERTESLSPAAWIDIGSVVAPEDGQVDFDDNAPPSSSAFYRTAAPMP